MLRREELAVESGGFVAGVCIPQGGAGRGEWGFVAGVCILQGEAGRGEWGFVAGVCIPQGGAGRGEWGLWQECVPCSPGHGPGVPLRAHCPCAH